MTDDLTFQDLLDASSDDIFVGRAEQLTVFESNLTATRPQFVILAVSGQGGVGKTTLLEKYARIAEQTGVVWARVDEGEGLVTEVLARFAKQFDSTGYPLKTFTERYNKYRELKQQIEADPSVPKGMLDVAFRGLTKVGLRSLKRVPIAGEISEVFLSPESEDKIAEEMGSLARFVAQKFTNKDEQVLLLETNSELARHFLNDLRKLAETRRILLIFDTYEQTAPYLDEWLRDLIGRKFGDISAKVRIVIGGRYPLSQPWTRFRGITRQIELSKFTDAEAREYLLRSGKTDEHEIQQIIELSEGLPVLLALLVSAPGEIPTGVAGSAVERFLQGMTSEQREIALLAAVPRFFNQDILEVLFPSETASSIFAWLIETHFVRSGERGWFYHDVVRTLVMQYLYSRSHTKWSEAHEKLAVYYEGWINELGIPEGSEQSNENWRKLEEERQYHILSARPDKNLSLMLGQWLAKVFDSIAKDMTAAETKQSIYRCALLLHQAQEETKQPDLLLSAEKSREFIASSQSREISSEACAAFLSWIGAQVTFAKPVRALAYAICSTFCEDDQTNLRYIDQAIALEPENGLYYLVQGAIYYHIDDFEKSIDSLSKAAERKPENSEIYLGRGTAYADLKNYAAALQDLNRAVELQPENGDNYYWRGRTYFRMQEYPTALLDFRRAVEFQPEDVYNYYWRGITYFEIQDYPAALQDFNRAVELQPENGYNYYERGKTHFQRQDFPSALQDFNRAVELQPERGTNYYWRGITYFEIQDYLAALQDFNRAVELQPEDGYNYYERGKTHFQMQDYPAALQDFNKAVKFQPENGYNYQWRGRTYYEIQDYPAALQDFSRAVEFQPENGYNYYWRGKTYFELQDYPAALEDFNRAVEFQPENGYYYYWRGKTYFEIQDYPAALQDFNRAVELQPENGYNFYERGSTHYQMQDFPSALQDFNRAVELQPENGYNFYWRGITYYEIEDYLAALQDFSRAVELQPENGYNHRWRGKIHGQMQDYPAALQDFNRAVELQPEKGNNYYWRGSTYYFMQDYPAAVDDLSRAIELQLNDSFNIASRGLVYAKMGNAAAAAADFEKVKDLAGTEGEPFRRAALGYIGLSNFYQACVMLDLAFQRDVSFIDEVLTGSEFSVLIETQEFQEILQKYRPTET